MSIDFCFTLGDDARETITEILDGSARFFGTLIVGMIFTALLTIIGLIWCCARCCGCGKGKRSTSFDSCKMSIYGLSMFVFVVLGGLTMAWLFAANG